MAVLFSDQRNAPPPPPPSTTAKHMSNTLVRKRSANMLTIRGIFVICHYLPICKGVFALHIDVIGVFALHIDVTGVFVLHIDVTSKKYRYSLLQDVLSRPWSYVDCHLTADIGVQPEDVQYAKLLLDLVNSEGQ